MEKNSKPTQCERVLSYMKQFGEIDQLSALKDLGIMRLGARIWELKHRGYNIQTRTEKGKNRYGEPTNWAVYSLAE